MSHMHTVKDNPKHKMKKKETHEVWTYETDEPHEHEPWLFPQVIGGYRADRIPGLLPSIAEISTTVVDDDRPENASQYVIPMPVDATESEAPVKPTPEPIQSEQQTQTTSSPTEEPDIVETVTENIDETVTDEPKQSPETESSPSDETQPKLQDRHYFINPEERTGEHTSKTPSPENIEPITYHAEPSPAEHTQPEEYLTEPFTEPQQTDGETPPLDSAERAMPGVTHLDHEPQRKEGEDEPKYAPIKVFDYVVYYNTPNKPKKPVAVLLGGYSDQTKSGCDEAKNLKIPHNEGKLGMSLIDINDIPVMRDSARVRHNKRTVKICPKEDAKACIYGQTGTGYTFGSDSVFIFSGDLIIAENNELRKVSPGRHLIEPTSGTTKFIICENDVCILIHSDSEYLIDDESYLDSKPTIDGKPKDKYHISPVDRQTIVEDDGIHSDSPHESVSESISETISDTESDSKAKPRSDQRSIGTQTEKSPPFDESKSFGLDYVVYYNRPNQSNEPVAVLLGGYSDQTNSECAEAKHLNISHNEGKIEMTTMNNSDIPVMKDAANVRHSKHIIKICPIGYAKACVYGQTGTGYTFGSDSLFIFSGILLIAENNELRKISPGTHLIEPHSGTTKFIICEKDVCILVPNDSSYLIDDESYLDTNKTIDGKPSDKYHISPVHQKPVEDRPHDRISDTIDGKGSKDKVKPVSDDKDDGMGSDSARERIGDTNDGKDSKDKGKPLSDGKDDGMGSDSPRERIGDTNGRKDSKDKVKPLSDGKDDDMGSDSPRERIGDTNGEKGSKDKVKPGIDHTSGTDRATQTGDLTGNASKGTQTERFPCFAESNVLSYVVYYHSLGKKDKPVAVLLGQVMSQTKFGCDEAKHLNIPNTNGKLSMAMMDNNDIPVMKDAVSVQHSNHIIKICPTDKAKACVYGQNGAGFIFGSDSLLIFSGVLLIAQNNELQKLSPGRHLIEPTSGTTKFIICENNVCILVHSDGGYKIDDIPYLDAKHSIDDKPRDKYHISPVDRQTIVEDDGIHSDSPHESVSESISETISETESESKAKPRGDQISRTDRGTQTEILPSFAESRVFSYVIYHHKHSSADKPIGVLFGKVLDQTKTGFDSKHLKIPHNEGNLKMALLDNNDIPLMRDAAVVQHSKQMVKICPIGDAKACIYGQTGCGYEFGSESIVLISGMLLIAENDSPKKLSPGRHLVEPKTGLTKFIICADGLSILVHTDGGYLIDDESYLD